jgi:hypothetical protein
MLPLLSRPTCHAATPRGSLPLSGVPGSKRCPPVATNAELVTDRWPQSRRSSAEIVSPVTSATAPVPALLHGGRRQRRGGDTMRAYLKAVAITVGLLGAWLALLPLVA